MIFAELDKFYLKKYSTGSIYHS